MTDTLNDVEHFGNHIYILNKPEFLDVVKPVALKELNKMKVADKMFPILQTPHIFDESFNEFANFIAQSAWNILSNQGYAMQQYNTLLNELWAQQFNMYGQQYEHIHNFGAQISGFYFLEVPKNSSRAIFHDPNHAKRQINLPEFDMSKVTPASTAVNYEVKPGDIILFNSWLPHSFAPNASSKPFRFLHFNVTVAPVQQNCEIPPAAEII